MSVSMKDPVIQRLVSEKDNPLLTQKVNKDGRIIFYLDLKIFMDKINFKAGSMWCEMKLVDRVNTIAQELGIQKK